MRLNPTSTGLVAVRLQLVHNNGAFLSLGASLPELWRHTLFNICTGVLLLGLFGYALFSKRITPVDVFAIALYFSGGVGNLADRWVHDGYVVDFINLGFGPLRTGIFNVADIFIMAGALILVAHVLHSRRNNF